ERGIERLRSQAFPRTTTAIQGAGQNIRAAYQQGGVPSAVGATVRNTLVPAIGLGHDLMDSARQALDPAAQAMRTAVTGNAEPIGSRPGRTMPQAPAGSAMRSPGSGAPQIAVSNTQPMPPNYDVGAGATIPSGSHQARQSGAVAGAPGVTRTVDPQGRVTYSGQGAADDPSNMQQDGTHDVVARLNRLREIYAGNTALRDQINFNQGRGGSFRKTTNEEIARDLLTGKSRSGRQAGLQMMQAQQQGQHQAREMTLREMLANPQIAAAQITAQQANRLNTLQRQLTQTQDPAERQRLAELIRSLSGQSTDRNAQVIYDEELLDPKQPMAGTRKVPMILNRDGTGSRVTQRQQAKPLPPGLTRDQVLMSARNFIANGADPAAVAERLQQFGFVLED
ncbi:MAG TPA: hypothetical protein PLU35_14410, partial [Phycisphaerales bacterium]|nr:hypothetical protein [Phycisphaerales bacterium]